MAIRKFDCRNVYNFDLIIILDHSNFKVEFPINFSILRYIFSLNCSTIKFKSKYNFLFHINMQFIQKHEIRIKRPSFCKAHFYTLKQFSLCGGVITMKPCISWSAFHNIGNNFLTIPIQLP